MSSRFKELFEEAGKNDKQGEEKPAKKKVRTIPKKPTIDPPEKNSAKVKGKRSNPEYTGAFAYIPIALHDEVKIQLLRNKTIDFSGLVENLLADWLDKQNQRN